jgi:hypothetical protein
LIAFSYSLQVIDIDPKPVSKIREKIAEEEEVCALASHAEKILRREERDGL